MNKRIICRVDQQQWYLHLADKRDCYIDTNNKDRVKTTWIDPEGSSYIVNVVYTALLLIVLFERAVTVEFPDDPQKRQHYLTEVTFQIPDIKKTEAAEAATVPPLTSWCCHRSAWGTWPCKDDLNQHLSFSLSFLRIGCACNMAPKTPHTITHS